MTRRIAVIGAGAMGEALLTSILKSGQAAADTVISENDDERARTLRHRHGVEVASPIAAVTGADIVLLAVKPTDLPTLLEQITERIDDDSIVVSVVGGVRTSAIEASLSSDASVFRVMPNIAAVVGEGMFGVSLGSTVTHDHVATVTALLESGGRVLVVDEQLQDGITAVSGSGPAYVYYLVEAMVAAGVACGIDADTAGVLARQTLVGSAKLLAESGDSAEQLRKRVASPNGTTQVAIDFFDAHGVKDVIIAGLLANAAKAAAFAGEV